MAHNGTTRSGPHARHVRGRLRASLAGAADAPAHEQRAGAGRTQCLGVRVLPAPTSWDHNGCCVAWSSCARTRGALLCVLLAAPGRIRDALIPQQGRHANALATQQPSQPSPLLCMRPRLRRIAPGLGTRGLRPRSIRLRVHAASAFLGLLTPGHIISQDRAPRGSVRLRTVPRCRAPQAGPADARHGCSRC
jgi:hypothetical protein